MRVLVVLSGVLILSAFYAGAAPTEDIAPSKPCESDAPGDGYQKETLSTLNKKSSHDTLNTKTKSKEKVKVKHLKGGRTMTVITDSSKTKTKKDSVSDEYCQANHTLTKGGVEDSSSLTQDHQHEVKETDVVKKKAREVIITDKYGNVISDKKKEKLKEKTKKKEKDHKSSTLIHTVKPAPPPAEDCDAPPVEPAPDC